MRALLAAALLPLVSTITGCGPDHLGRSDQPLTVAEVARRGDLKFPFPVGAHNIYYGVYHDWQVFELIVRFDLPPAECPAAVVAILQREVQPVSAQTEMVLPQCSSLSPALWFEGQRVAAGGWRAGGELDGSGSEPVVWVDLALGRVYYREAD